MLIPFLLGALDSILAKTFKIYYYYNPKDEEINRTIIIALSTWLFSGIIYGFIGYIFGGFELLWCIYFLVGRIFIHYLRIFKDNEIDLNSTTRGLRVYMTQVVVIYAVMKLFNYFESYSFTEFITNPVTCLIGLPIFGAVSGFVINFSLCIINNNFFMMKNLDEHKFINLQHLDGTIIPFPVMDGYGLLLVCLGVSAFISFFSGFLGLLCGVIINIITIYYK